MAEPNQRRGDVQGQKTFLLSEPRLQPPLLLGSVYPGLAVEGSRSASGTEPLPDVFQPLPAMAEHHDGQRAAEVVAADSDASFGRDQC